LTAITLPEGHTSPTLNPDGGGVAVGCCDTLVPACLPLPAHIHWHWALADSDATWPWRPPRIILHGSAISRSHRPTAWQHAPMHLISSEAVFGRCESVPDDLSPSSSSSCDVPVGVGGILALFPSILLFTNRLSSARWLVNTVLCPWALIQDPIHAAKSMTGSHHGCSICHTTSDSSVRNLITAGPCLVCHYVETLEQSRYSMRSWAIVRKAFDKSNQGRW